MTNVNASTPLGTRCVFIGPAIQTPERVGTTVTIEVHVAKFSIEQVALAARFGFMADVVVRAESDGQLAATAYSSLIRIDPDSTFDDEPAMTEQPRAVTA